MRDEDLFADGPPSPGPPSIDPHPHPQPPESGSDRPGLPWEMDDPGHTPAGGLQTISAVLFSPADAFDRMRQTGGFGDAILFVLVFGTIGTLLGLLWQSALRTMLGSVAGADIGALVLGNSFAVLMLILSPLLILLWSVVQAAIYHALLLLLGGAPKPFETTYRVVCYATGATYLWLAIPMCGGLVSTVWNLIATIVGLHRAQQIPMGRAAAAVILPLVLVCLCCAALFGFGIIGALTIPGFVE